MDNYEYLKQRVLELNLSLTQAKLKGNKIESKIIEMLMSYYMDKMLKTKKTI